MRRRFQAKDMTSRTQRVCWKASGFLKNVLASQNARRLDRQRFGPECEQVLRGIAGQDDWLAEQFADYQAQHLGTLIPKGNDRKTMTERITGHTPGLLGLRT